MPPHLTIRGSTPEDAPGIREALEGVAHERKFLAMLEAPTVERVAAFTANPRVTQVVAVEGERVVGWADVMRMEADGFEHRGVLGMGVIASRRRLGIGRQLLTEVTHRARDFGVVRLELEVFKSNSAAVALYESQGFRCDGDLSRARILDGVVDDLLLMSRWLATKPESA